jgi:hypothetical protein
MPRSKTRGSRKDHNKRVANRNQKITADVRAINDIKQKIFQEAMERYKQEQETSGKTGNTYKIKL